jgi:hypothetical protein
MAEQALPSLEASAAAAADALAGIDTTLGPGAGVAIAAFPPDFTWQWQQAAYALVDLGYSLDSLKVSLGAAFAGPVNALSYNLQAAIGGGLSDLSGDIGSLVEPLDRIADATEAAGADVAQATRSGADGVKAVDETLRSGKLKAEVTANVPGLAGVSDILNVLYEGLKRLSGSSGGAGDFKAIEDSLKAGHVAALREVLGQSGDGGMQQLVPTTFRNIISQVFANETTRGTLTKDTVKGLLDAIPEIVASLPDAWIRAIQNAGGLIEHHSPGALDSVVGELGGWIAEAWQWLANSGEATPESATQRAVQAYGIAAGLGLAAMALSAATSWSIAGCSPPKLGGILRILGQLASFQPLGNAIAGTAYRTWLSTPLGFQMSAGARQNIPSAGDLMGWLASRELTQTGSIDLDHPVPFGFRKAMQYWGFNDAWIDLYTISAHRRPAQRDLARMAQLRDRSDEWWASHIRETNLNEDNVPEMTEALQEAIAATERTAWWNELQYMRSRGLITREDLMDRASAREIPAKRREYGADAADLELERRQLEKALTTAEYQYERDQLTDAEFDGEVSAIVQDPRTAYLIKTLAHVKRYHKVWRWTPTEEAQKSLPVYREAFNQGLSTLAEYESQLIIAGVEGEVKDLLVDLADAARNRTLAAEFRSYALPQTRDAVVHGLLTPAEYKSKLRAAKFPEWSLDVEVRYAEALKTRRLQGRVERYQIPPFEQAYVYGLIQRSTLTRAYNEAGLTAAEIAAQTTLLDSKRLWEAEKARTAAEREEDRRNAEEERRRAAERKARLREEELIEKARRKALEEKRKQAAAVMKAAAAAVRKLLANKDPLAVQQVEAYIGQLERVYAAAVGILPDNLWTLAQELQDIAAKPGTADFAAMDSVMVQILAKLAP